MGSTTHRLSPRRLWSVPAPRPALLAKALTHKLVSLAVQGVSIGVSDLASDSADVVLLATAGTTPHPHARPGPPHAAGKTGLTGVRFCAEPIGKLVELITLGKKVHGVAKNGERSLSHCKSVAKVSRPVPSAP